MTGEATVFSDIMTTGSSCLYDTFGAARTAGAIQAIDLAKGTIEPQLSPEALAEVWEAGRTLPIDGAVAMALAFQLQEPPTGRGTTSTRSILSNREADVMQLIVAGHSDRQIAEALFISHRTVQGHVASTFNKLGVNSRTAAATMAIRLGLVRDDRAAPDTG